MEQLWAPSSTLLIRPSIGIAAMTGLAVGFYLLNRKPA